MPGTQVIEQQKEEEHRRLAGDVLGAHQRLRQVDLQRVGAPIVGDEPGADVDRDEEDEQVLLLEILAERLAVGARTWPPAGSWPRSKSDGADEKRHPRHDQQAEEQPLADHGHDPGLGDHQPRRPGGAFVAAR